MRRLAFAAVLLLAASGSDAGDSGVVRPFETDASAARPTQLDSIVVAAQRRRGVEPANVCSDEVFVRRAYLDVIGTLPEPEDVRAFLADKRPGKRGELIDRLLARDEFADYWAMKWCDVLRVKAEFPINLWPNAAQAYSRWVHDAIRDGMPYDRFARELLTASGSNFRVPQVNFYRAVQGRTPASIAAAVALTFMGERYESWPETRRATTALFFSRVAFKKTAEWKEEIVLCDPAPAEPLDTFLPDGTAVRVASGDDPRRVFADWLVSPSNRSFARAAVNRVWAWLMGRGIVHEADDLRPDNPPALPGVLEYLERELVIAKYDLRRVYRLILESRTYQQSSIPHGDPAAAEAAFACYPVRRLEAEVLMDALCWLGGPGEGYSSVVPEPYTFIPGALRTIDLPDGSITSPFLEMFGRPPRDTGRASERDDAPSAAQRLWLLNSTELQRRIERSPRLRAVVAAARGDAEELVRELYLTLLSRRPTDGESAVARDYLRGAGRAPREAAADLAWALVNSKEFLYRH